MDGTLGNVRKFAQATGRDLHVDAAATGLSVGYRPEGLIAPDIYPPVPVPKQSDLYYVWTKDDFLRLNNPSRAPGAPVPRIHFSVSSQTYFANGYGFASELPFEDLDNADDVLELRSTAGNFIMDQLNLAWEDRLAVTLTTTTNMGSSTALANAWSDAVNGTPIDDIFAGTASIRSTTGKEPNVMILSWPAWNNLRKHPDIISFVRGAGDNTGGGPVNEQQVGAAFNIPKVLIGKGIKNTADEDQTGVYTDIWSNACILLHVAPAPGRMVPSHGYTFRWTPAGFPAPFTTMRRTNDDNKTEIVETLHYQDEAVVASELGYLIVGAN